MRWNERPRRALVLMKPEQELLPLAAQTINYLQQDMGLEVMVEVSAVEVVSQVLHERHVCLCVCVFFYTFFSVLRRQELFSRRELLLGIFRGFSILKAPIEGQHCSSEGLNRPPPFMLPFFPLPSISCLELDPKAPKL